MLRDRKASMADRSLSSLTGELLLLATTAAAFATFAARRLGSDEHPCGSVRERARVGNKVALGSNGVGRHECGGGLGVRKERVEVHQETAGIVTRAT